MSQRSTSSKRSARKSKPSARYRRVIDDDHLEIRIQNAYSFDENAHSKCISTRTLSLSQQRDMANGFADPLSFRLPTLAQLCATVAAENFGTWLLPSREIYASAEQRQQNKNPSPQKRRLPSKAKTTSSKRQRQKQRAFGAPPDSDDEAEYLPSCPDSDSDVQDDHPPKPDQTRSNPNPSSTKKVQENHDFNRLSIHNLTIDDLKHLSQRNSELMKMLPPQASFQLYQTMCKLCPQLVTRFVISCFFLPSLALSSSSQQLRSPRTHLWFPASLPLFSNDSAAASFLLGNIAHSISAYVDKITKPIPSTTMTTTFTLRSLQLHGLTRLQDKTLARLFEAAIPKDDQLEIKPVFRLEHVSLKGCIQIGNQAVKAMCRVTGTTVTYLNLDYTDISAQAIESILELAPNLVTLKIGNVQNLSDNNLRGLVETVTLRSTLSNPPFFPLSKLTNLRLRGSQIGDIGIGCLLSLCGKTLTTLDISYTNIACKSLSLQVVGYGLGLDMGNGTNRYNCIKESHHHPSFQPTTTTTTTKSVLKKINLSGLKICQPGLLCFLLSLPKSIETILLSSIRNWQNHQLEEISLQSFRPFLYHFFNGLDQIERVDLSDSKGLWLNHHGQELLNVLIQKCKKLNLSQSQIDNNIQYRSSSPSTQQQQPSEEDIPSRLENLNVSYINPLPFFDFFLNCKKLKTVQFEETNVTEDQINWILERNPYIVELNLNKCRNITRQKRRGYFSQDQ